MVVTLDWHSGMALDHLIGSEVTISERCDRIELRNRKGVIAKFPYPSHLTRENDALVWVEFMDNITENMIDGAQVDLADIVFLNEIT